MAAIPHLKAADSKKTLSRFRRLARWSWTPEPSFYESMSDEDRIIAIGSCIAASSKWAAEHGRQVEWLAEQGLTTKDAARRYREWREAKVARFKRGKSVSLSGEKKREQQGSVRNGRGKRRGKRSKG